MRYYKIDIKGHYREVGRIASDAEGDKIPNADYYFKKIRAGELVTDAPLFDYFYLKSFDKKEFWEWKLCDVHMFIGEASRLSICWFVSEKLRLLFAKFNLSIPNHFYPSKLLYKGEMLDYYIFQFTGNLVYKQTLDYVDYPASAFWNPEKKTDIIVSDKYNFLSEWDRVYKENNSIAKIIQFKKLVFKEHLDFFPIGTLMKDNIISEKLKNAMEENGIEGFEFSELDYEVAVEK